MLRQKMFPLCTQTEETIKVEDGQEDLVRERKTLLSYIPFSTIGMHNWKLQAKSLSENPGPIMDLIKGIIATHNPTFLDIQQNLLTGDERDRVREAMLKILKEELGNVYERKKR